MSSNISYLGWISKILLVAILMLSGVLAISLVTQNVNAQESSVFTVGFDQADNIFVVSNADDMSGLQYRLIESGNIGGLCNVIGGESTNSEFQDYNAAGIDVSAHINGDVEDNGLVCLRGRPSGGELTYESFALDVDTLPAVDVTSVGASPSSVSKTGVEDGLLLGSLFIIGVVASVACVGIWRNMNRLPS